MQENPKDQSFGSPLLLSVEDAARMLSMGRSTFWQNVGEGHLPQPIRIGGLTRWRAAELEAWVKGKNPERAPVSASECTGSVEERLRRVEAALIELTQAIAPRVDRTQLAERFGIHRNTLRTRLARD